MPAAADGGDTADTFQSRALSLICLKFSGCCCWCHDEDVDNTRSKHFIIINQPLLLLLLIEEDSLHKLDDYYNTLLLSDATTEYRPTE